MCGCDVEYGFGICFVKTSVSGMNANVLASPTAALGVQAQSAIYVSCKLYNSTRVAFGGAAAALECDSTTWMRFLAFDESAYEKGGPSAKRIPMTWQNGPQPGEAYVDATSTSGWHIMGG